MTIPALSVISQAKSKCQGEARVAIKITLSHLARCLVVLAGRSIGTIAIGLPRYTLASDEACMTQEMPARSELIDEFQADEESCFDSGAKNNITDIALTITSVVASLAATVLVSATSHKPLAASVAAIPAACTALQRIVDFRGRSLWYFHHSANLKALVLSLKYAKNPDLEEFAKRRADIEIEGEFRWAQIGGARAGQEGEVKRGRKPRPRPSGKD
jgi:hypothetical protein